MMTIDNGLIITDPTTNQCAGYIFNFNGHGAFDPSGRIDGLTQEQIDTHNSLLASAEWEAIKKHGRGVLYLVKEDDGQWFVKTWASQYKARVYSQRKSWHNMAGRDGRTDVWFMLDGSRWHGVNIGDNQICRVKRCKN